ncbi:sulfite exporter TauE/SafE family protein [Nitratireductor sp. XY-223]|uniref:sulfite exporter TauE/SafE family protein n=1 Tax=Nitratireductor sp. XY-223 TaxID=2561926 RepID=UPI0010A9A9A2|nr:sulfite exporter TauE/SafE family protein [Nitratireductor sp. XY-223]
MTLEAYLVTALAVVLTGISKSGFAGGLGILGVPLVALTMSPQAAAVLLLPILIGIDVLSVWRYRRAWQVRMIVALLPGAALGIGLGMMGFSRIDPDVLRIAIGTMALGFVLRFALARSPNTKPRASWPAILVASAVSGFAGFVAHAGGPPIKGTLLRAGLDKSAFVGTNAFFFFLLNLAKAAGYSALGLFTVESVVASALMLPCLFAGVGLGFALHRRVPQATFTALAHGLLAVAGINLLLIGGASFWSA